MPYGLPCTEEPNPADVFVGVEQFDVAFGAVVQAIMEAIASEQTETDGYIRSVTDPLTKWVQRQLAQVAKLLGGVLDALSLAVTTQGFVTNATLASAIQDIADALGTTSEEIIYGPTPVPATPQPFPPGTRPVLPSPLPTGVPPFPPGTAPEPPTAPVPGGQPPSAAITLSVAGATITALALGGPVQVGAPVMVDGNRYNPTVTVYQSASSPPLGVPGTTTIPVTVDQQDDGSTVVSVGPVHVHVSAPPSALNPNAPQCGVEPAPFGV